ncbi:hypothetical protein [Streptosporangium brasiliense]|uniref:Uncharacterized protein n=1 Tax=Streptosporangium brasiliense TaxID=47480 RepID=A0ABT9REM7_9ACTN|nr:hypothetical protein [Streptosporangium brasiliense]MDP9867723.1 hypothetical protein [Streptosporangium brasiliense]
MTGWTRGRGNGSAYRRCPPERDAALAPETGVSAVAGTSRSDRPPATGGAAVRWRSIGAVPG